MRRLVALAVSMALLLVIYWRIDGARIWAVLVSGDPWWLTTSLAMVVPLTFLTAWRLQQLMPADAPLGIGEATRLVLAASALNMVLPSKMGDLAKAYALAEHHELGGARSISLVVFEKACDMLALLVWCVAGLALAPTADFVGPPLAATLAAGVVVGVLALGSRRFARGAFRLVGKLTPSALRGGAERLETSWYDMQAGVLSDRRLAARVAATSLFLWFLHLLQIWLFTVALGHAPPFVASLALAPLALLAGLLPFTFAGVGVRDAAFIVLYRPYIDAPTGAALGLLATARYLLPALGGVPLVTRYMPPAVRAQSP